MTQGDPNPGTGPMDPAASEQLAATLVQMAGLVLSQETVRSAVELVTALASATAPGSAGAAVTLVDEHGTRTMAATTELAARADALQYSLDEGPCLTAARTGRIVRVDDAVGDRRWPAWNEAVTHLGIRSTLSAPLVSATATIGAIKLYALQPARFDEHAEQVMVLFARQAAILLAATQDLTSARALSRRLADALTDRDVIGQATGVLQARGLPDREAAFARLAAAAERSGRPVREVALELLTTVTAGDADSAPA
ncbi:GAF domain-containing protein [Geodermatophilus sp. DSM 44513]|uniref:GAF domain-containing protein n=1 Tax=Geodermatophilus sp. DSM 44513 TaxID=1528104 RepID=UPI00127FBCEF|nr:GAF domain-containing protein [Geodermatophilus sp. DSM 44513]WNV77205.1 GAF domain-containing protein [Geodermatophilus sp. DSM 44513]